MRYAVHTARKLCQRLAAGENLQAICRESRMPDRLTVYRWLIDRPDFRTLFLQAKQLSAQALCDQMIEIADGDRGDEPGRLPRDRLRVDARKQFVAQLPKTLAPLTEFDALNLLPEDLDEFDFRIERGA